MHFHELIFDVPPCLSIQTARVPHMTAQPAPTAPAPASDPTSTESPPVATPRRSLRRRLAKPGLVLLCLLIGVASGVVAQSKFTKVPEPEPAKEYVTKPEPVPVADLTPQSALTRIDTLIGAGAFREALTTCKAAPRAGTADERAMAYREAICLEALDRLKEAKDAYHRAEPPEGNVAAWARAMLGQARCAAAADDLASAQALLDRVVLASGHPDCKDSHVLEECLFLRARLEALRLGAVRRLDPLDPDAIAWPPLDGSLDQYQEWLSPDTLPAVSVGIPAGPNVLEARRTAGVSGGFAVTAHCAERPVAQTVQAIAGAAGLTLHMDATTATALAKPGTLDVESLPLGDVLDALLGRFGVGWKIEGKALTVAPAAAVPTVREAAAKSFRRALTTAPAHPRVVAVRVWLANFDFVAGRVREAQKEYLHVLETSPETPETPHAVYNLGLAELRLGALQSARSRFVDLVDRGARTKWADYGWWWAGRTHLDVGDPAAAKKAFQTACSGNTPEVTSAAALGMCACELLEGNDDPARVALRGSRLVARDDHMALETAFESLLRYKATPTEGRRVILLADLSATGDARAIGPGGVYLAGRIYRELGMPEKTAAIYDAATDSIRGPLAMRMTFDAAEWYDLIDRYEPARQRYLAVAAVDPKGLGSKAELRLAGIALRLGNADECLRRCRAVLDRPGVERGEVLSLMGRGYEQQRNYRLAAECFAGRVPAE